MLVYIQGRLRSTYVKLITQIMKGGWPFNDGNPFHSICDVVIDDTRVGCIELKRRGNGLVTGRYRDKWLLSCWMQYETISQHHLQHQQQQLVEGPFGIAAFRNFGDIFDAQLHPMINRAHCHLCYHEMLASKDLSTVIHLEEKKFLCADESMVHVYHTSCLILWILYHEYYEHCKGERNPCPGCSYYTENKEDLYHTTDLLESIWEERDLDEPALGLRIRSNIPQLHQPPERIFVRAVSYRSILVSPYESD